MALMCTTAETGYPKGPDDKRTHGEAMLARPGIWGKVPPLRMDRTVKAFVHMRQSRWVVLCPWCPSAQFAPFTESDRRFFCPDCGNAAVEGKWVAVVWPEDPETIEMIVALRPSPVNHNWEPGETPTKLLAENIAHGDVALAGMK